jgi:hypothetical protein
MILTSGPGAAAVVAATQRMTPLVAAEPGLSALSDDFNSGATDVEARGWSWYKESSVSTQSVASGRFRLGINAGGTTTVATGNSSFWFNTADGCLLYKEVDGDVDMRARITIWNSTFDGLPSNTSFRLGGIACHNPSRASNVFNYVHVGGGVVNGVYSFETKSTTNNVSTFPADAMATASPWIVDIRLVRAGSVLTSYGRNAPGATALASNVGMTQLRQFTRADLPSTCQWGLMLYSNAVGHGIGIDYDEVQFAEVA